MGKSLGRVRHDFLSSLARMGLLSLTTKGVCPLANLDSQLSKRVAKLFLGQLEADGYAIDTSSGFAVKEAQRCFSDEVLSFCSSSVRRGSIHSCDLVFEQSVDDPSIINVSSFDGSRCIYIGCYANLSKVNLPSDFSLVLTAEMLPSAVMRFRSSFGHVPVYHISLDHLEAALDELGLDEELEDFDLLASSGLLRDAVDFPLDLSALLGR